MATDATGTPSTNFSFPKYNTAIDAPSGLGLNAIVTDIDAKLALNSVLLGAVARSIIAKAGTTVGTRRKLNLIEGTNITLTVTDDSANEKVDVTITGSAAAGVPTGSITQFAAAAAPSGWVLCDGTSYLRSGGGVDALFAVIGTTYGSVDGTHFTVPDMRGRMPAGYAASGGHIDVATLGNADAATIANRRPSHKHTAAVGSLGTGNDSPDHTHSGAATVLFSVSSQAGSNAAQVGASTGGASARHTHTVTGAPTVGPQTGAEPTDTVSYLVVNYIIKT